VHSYYQPQINATVTNGNSKPRPRARRGQATDPHSIAERVWIKHPHTGLRLILDEKHESGNSNSAN
jgi:hypothetical protein